MSKQRTGIHKSGHWRLCPLILREPTTIQFTTDFTMSITSPLLCMKQVWFQHFYYSSLWGFFEKSFWKATTKTQQLCKRLLFYKIKQKVRDPFTRQHKRKKQNNKQQLKNNKKRLCVIYKNPKRFSSQQKSSNPARTHSLWDVVGRNPGDLLLGVGDLHGAGGRDPEALQRVFGHARLRVALKLHKGNVVFPRDQPDLLEARKPAEGHGAAVRHMVSQSVRQPASQSVS